ANPEPNTGCWLWDSTLTRAGPLIGHGGRELKARAVSLELSGRPRPKGAYTISRCGVTACVSPEHLFWGSAKDYPRRLTLRQRFMKFVRSDRPNSECWLWIGSIKRGGYGAFNVGGKDTNPTHIALEL